MPTVIVLWLLYGVEALLVIEPRVQLALLWLIFFATFVVPSAMLYFLKRGGFIESMSLRKREERPLPFMITTVFYGFFTYLFLDQANFDRLIAFNLVGITASMFLATFISRFYKISMHSMGIGGAMGVFIALQLHYGMWISVRTPILLFLVLWRLVMSARLYLRAHTMSQVWAGWLLSLVINFGALQLYFEMTHLG